MPLRLSAWAALIGSPFAIWSDTIIHMYYCATRTLIAQYGLRVYLHSIIEVVTHAQLGLLALAT